MSGAATTTTVTGRPELAAFTRRCRGRARRRFRAKSSSTGPVRAELARRWLELKLLRRGRWSLHRHAHLVAAFEDAASRGPVTSMLSVGCGVGVSELLLAVDHPEVRFTLSDIGGDQLDRARRTARVFGLSNARVLDLDLLDPPPVPGHDLVVSIEVLEHIDDDRRAIESILALSRRFVWVLVPYADERRLASSTDGEKALERHGHVRPGYSERTMRERFADTDVVWLRNCYRQPASSELRHWMGRHGLLRRRLAARRLFRGAAEDVQAGLVDDDDALAHGIEVLATVR